MLSRLRRRLARSFDARLGDAARYAERVRSECRAFPEGDLLPYVLPAVAYGNLALRDRSLTPHVLSQMEKLIELVLPAVIRETSAPGGDLAALHAHGEHAVYVGWLNLALGCYRQAGGGGRFEALHRSLSDGLHGAVVRAGGRPLRSFPHRSWPFDTLPCLLSLALHDAHTGVPRSAPAIRPHLEWVQSHATHQPLGLPHSDIEEDTGEGRELPRGGDLSGRVCLLAHLDRAYAETLYRRYAAAYWIRRGLLAGFSEWPHGAPAGLHIRQDIDSGPLLKGIGLSATGFGMGAAIAMRDHRRLRWLCAQMAAMAVFRRLVHPWIEQIGVASAAGHVTGFLFGDACLFWAASWEPWPCVRG